MDKFISAMFRTKAFVYDENHTNENGQKEPYIIDVPMIFGGTEIKNELIQFIKDEVANEDKMNIALDIFDKIIDIYDNNEMFKGAIDDIKDSIETQVDMKYVDYISGGEGNDWLFSIILAYFFGKPHMTIFRDGTIIVFTSDFEEGNEVQKVEDAKIMHIGDMLDTGITHSENWFTTIRNIGSDIYWNVCIADLMHGGAEKVREYNAEPVSVMKPNDVFFKRSLELGLINTAQYNVLIDFAANRDFGDIIE